MNIPLALKLTAWLSLAVLVFVTLGPVADRPTSMQPHLERSLALLIVGFLFAVAYPRRFVFMAALVLGSTILLELLQLLDPGRHGRVIDAVVKLAGGSVGLALGGLLNRLRPRPSDN